MALPMHTVHIGTASEGRPTQLATATAAAAGLQAALVADSPYYKLLIGRVLGYAEPNIRHHILVSFLVVIVEGEAGYRLS